MRSSHAPGPTPWATLRQRLTKPVLIAVGLWVLVGYCAVAVVTGHG